MKPLLIIPAYNESENIESLLNEITTNYPQYDYVVINDCSTDQTLNILSLMKANCINLPVNLGIGGSIQTGYQYAMEHGYEIAVQIDGDGQHDPKYVSDVITPIEDGQADVVIGSRYVKREGFQSSYLRRFGIAILSVLIKVLCGVRIRDVTSGMRAVNQKMISEYAKNYAQDYPEPEAILTAGIMKARVAEVPVQMRERQGGVSSINAARSIYYMIKVSLALVITRMTAG